MLIQLKMIQIWQQISWSLHWSQGSSEGKLNHLMSKNKQKATNPLQQLREAKREWSILMVFGSIFNRLNFDVEIGSKNECKAVLIWRRVYNWKRNSNLGATISDEIGLGSSAIRKWLSEIQSNERSRVWVSQQLIWRYTKMIQMVVFEVVGILEVKVRGRDAG